MRTMLSKIAYTMAPHLEFFMLMDPSPRQIKRGYLTQICQISQKEFEVYLTNLSPILLQYIIFHHFWLDGLPFSYLSFTHTHILVQNHLPPSVYVLFSCFICKDRASMTTVFTSVLSEEANDPILLMLVLKIRYNTRSQKAHLIGKVHILKHLVHLLRSGCCL